MSRGANNFGRTIVICDINDCKLIRIPKIAICKLQFGFVGYLRTTKTMIILTFVIRLLFSEMRKGEIRRGLLNFGMHNACAQKIFNTTHIAISRIYVNQINGIYLKYSVKHMGGITIR